MVNENDTIILDEDDFSNASGVIEVLDSEDTDHDVHLPTSVYDLNKFSRSSTRSKANSILSKKTGTQIDSTSHNREHFAGTFSVLARLRKNAPQFESRGNKGKSSINSFHEGDDISLRSKLDAFIFSFVKSSLDDDAFDVSEDLDDEFARISMHDPQYWLLEALCTLKQEDKIRYTLRIAPQEDSNSNSNNNGNSQSITDQGKLFVQISISVWFKSAIFLPETASPCDVTQHQAQQALVGALFSHLPISLDMYSSLTSSSNPNIDAPCDVDVLSALYDAIRPTDTEEIEELPSELLIPKLRPYQRRGVAWMKKREQGTALRSTISNNDNLPLHPLWLEIRTAGNAPEDSSPNVFYYNPITGGLSREKIVDNSHSVKGGILGEAMGLGKTVETIATIIAHPREINENSDSDEEMVSSASKGKGKHKQALVVAKSTLIICPNTIVQQWVSEITRHAPRLSVYVYKGIKYDDGGGVTMGDVEAKKRELAANDVVLTTYEVLKTEVHFAETEPKYNLRGEKKYKQVHTPLLGIDWWRVCLDEAQMVSNSTTGPARLALKLHCVNRWCVTGTPIKRSLNDLYGLLLFLQHPIFGVTKHWWTRLLQSFITNVKASKDNSPHWSVVMLREVLRSVMWRHSKKHVAHELALPPQKQHVIMLKLSDIERNHYQNVYRECIDLLPARFKIDERMLLGDGNSATAMEAVAEIRRQRENKIEKKSPVYSLLSRLMGACVHQQLSKPSKQRKTGGRRRRRTNAKNNSNNSSFDNNENRQNMPLSMREVLHLMIEDEIDNLLKSRLDLCRYNVALANIIADHDVIIDTAGDEQPGTSSSNAMDLEESSNYYDLDNNRIINEDAARQAQEMYDKALAVVEESFSDLARLREEKQRIRMAAQPAYSSAPASTPLDDANNNNAVASSSTSKQASNEKGPEDNSSSDDDGDKEPKIVNKSEALEKMFTIQKFAALYCKARLFETIGNNEYSSLLDESQRLRSSFTLKATKRLKRGIVKMYEALSATDAKATKAETQGDLIFLSSLTEGELKKDEFASQVATITESRDLLKKHLDISETNAKDPSSVLATVYSKLFQESIENFDISENVLLSINAVSLSFGKLLNKLQGGGILNRAKERLRVDRTSAQASALRRCINYVETIAIPLWRKELGALQHLVDVMEKYVAEETELIAAARRHLDLESNKRAWRKHNNKATNEKRIKEQKTILSQENVRLGHHIREREARVNYLRGMRERHIQEEAGNGHTTAVAGGAEASSSGTNVNTATTTTANTTAAPETEEKICVICQEHFADITTPLVLTPCGHLFCKECIVGHLRVCQLQQKFKGCPVCRNAISLVSLKEVTVESVLGNDSPKKRKNEEDEDQDQLAAAKKKRVDGPEAHSHGHAAVTYERLSPEIKAIKVRGDYGTKIDTLIKYFKYLNEHEPDAKSLVFTQWSTAVDIVCESLDKNNIEYARLDNKDLKHKHQKKKQEAQLKLSMSASAAASKAQSTESEITNDDSDNDDEPPSGSESDNTTDNSDDDDNTSSLKKQKKKDKGKQKQKQQNKKKRNAKKAKEEKFAITAQAVARFVNDPECKVFVLCTSKGSHGLTLTSATHVFLLDPIINPAMEQQAINRVHRIGQDKTTHVYKFITEHTVEERVLDLFKRKMALTAASSSTSAKNNNNNNNSTSIGSSSGSSEEDHDNDDEDEDENSLLKKGEDEQLMDKEVRFLFGLGELTLTAAATTATTTTTTSLVAKSNNDNNSSNSSIDD